MQLQCSNNSSSGHPNTNLLFFLNKRLTSNKLCGDCFEIFPVFTTCWHAICFIPYALRNMMHWVEPNLAPTPPCRLPLIQKVQDEAIWPCISSQELITVSPLPHFHAKRGKNSGKKQLLQNPLKTMEQLLLISINFALSPSYCRILLLQESKIIAGSTRLLAISSSSNKCHHWEGHRMNK